LRRVRKEIQEHLVDLRSNAFDRRQPAECPVHGDPVFEEVIDQREARFELLVQVHGLQTSAPVRANTRRSRTILRARSAPSRMPSIIESMYLSA